MRDSYGQNKRWTDAWKGNWRLHNLHTARFHSEVLYKQNDKYNRRSEAQLHLPHSAKAKWVFALARCCPSTVCPVLSACARSPCRSSAALAGGPSATGGDCARAGTATDCATGARRVPVLAAALALECRLRMYLYSGTRPLVILVVSHSKITTGVSVLGM